MNIRRLLFRLRKKKPQQKVERSAAGNKKVVVFQLEKRQKFVIGVVVLSVMLFSLGSILGRSAIYVSIVLAILSVFFLWWAIREDLKGNFSINVFILPFFYSLALSLFYFLVPARLLFRGLLTVCYAVGLYSLFLTQNVFIVASIRTIALLSGARIVSLIITLLSFAILTNILFSFHWLVFITIPVFWLFAFALVHQSLWTYNVQKNQERLGWWTLGLTICLVEAAVILWFWPSSPTVIAVFLTGFFSSMVGLAHVWLEKRLFRGVLWEYLWVSAVVFFGLLLFTQWGK